MPRVVKAMPHDTFDLAALQSALDARRIERGLSWAALGAELGMSASTLSGFGSRPVAEGDGVLRAVAWLGRNLESFVPGGPQTNTKLPMPAGKLRFDVVRINSAIEASRAKQGLTWAQVATATGTGSASALTRLRNGGRVMFPSIMGVLAWLGRPSNDFVRIVDQGWQENDATTHHPTTRPPD